MSNILDRHERRRRVFQAGVEKTQCRCRHTMADATICQLLMFLRPIDQTILVRWHLTYTHI